MASSCFIRTPMTRAREVFRVQLFVPLRDFRARKTAFFTRVALDLKCRVRNAEALLKLSRGIFKKGVIRFPDRHHKMNRQGVQCGAERPDMKVMQIDDARERAEPRLDSL